MLKRILFHLVIFVPILLCIPNKSYGPFNLRLAAFELCHAPKQKDCAVMQARIIGLTKVLANMTVIKACSPSKGKILVLSNGKEITRLHMNKPCQHLFLKPIFETLYNATKGCQVPKGQYLQEIDIGQYVTNYFGGNFFYGNVSFRTHLFNDECNFACNTIDLELTPKK